MIKVMGTYRGCTSLLGSPTALGAQREVLFAAAVFAKEERGRLEMPLSLQVPLLGFPGVLSQEASSSETILTILTWSLVHSTYSVNICRMEDSKRKVCADAGFLAARQAASSTLCASKG